MELPSTSVERDRSVRRAGTGVAALFWCVQFLELLLVMAVEGQATARVLLLSRAMIVICGMILTLPIIEVAVRTGRQPFRVRLVATVSTALAMCVCLLGVNYLSVLVRSPLGRAPFDLVEFVYSGFGWSWFFLGVAGAVVGLSYSIEVRDRDRHLAAMGLVARDARLATLRYQLNPHFLFNTLNSITALIHAGENDPAEEMTESLSEFLRVTLEMDPVERIRLDREIQLQSLYLAIEQVRFPKRLRTRVDVGPDVAGVRVPALILQPLVENAILHGVAKSPDPVDVSISATRRDGRLHLVVENDVSGGDALASGRAGVGLRNVRARIQASFGDDQIVTSGRVGRRFRVHLDLPIKEEVAR